MADLDVIEERFHPKRVKVPKVVCQQSGVQAIGRLQIKAPANLTLVNGQFQQCGHPVIVTLENGSRSPQLLSATVIPGRVMNTGIVYATLTITTTEEQRIYTEKNIPILWHDAVSCPGVEPGDIVQKHDFLIEGFENVTGYCDHDGQFWLLLAVAVRYCLVVASERILKVDASQQFC